MLKRFGGFIANVKLPPLLIPKIPCSLKSDPRCNEWFIPSMKGQKSCLRCLNHEITNRFPAKTKREEVIADIIITWENDKDWNLICKILINNKKEYDKYSFSIFKDF